jgi:peroxiredoxin Q/BCP
VQIIGASFNDPETNDAWAEQEGFQYDLWTDQGRELALYYGAATTPTAGSAKRITLLLDPTGTLVLEYPAVATGTHPGEVYQDCVDLFGP